MNELRAERAEAWMVAGVCVVCGVAIAVLMLLAGCAGMADLNGGGL